MRKRDQECLLTSLKLVNEDIIRRDIHSAQLRLHAIHQLVKHEYGPKKRGPRRGPKTDT